MSRKLSKKEVLVLQEMRRRWAVVGEHKRPEAMPALG